MTFAAVLFDLDGVLVDSARFHLKAWQALATGLGLPFDRDVERRLRGVGRMDSLEIILGAESSRFSDAEKASLAQRKNDHYRALVADLTPDDALPGAFAALEAVRKAGLKIALASASRNAPALVARVGIADYLDATADPAKVAAGKPAPDLFLEAARLIGAAPATCLGVEDAEAGVRSIKSAGMTAVGVGQQDELTEADYIIADMTQFRLADYRPAL